MICDENEHFEQIIFACFYCENVMHITSKNNFPMTLSCTNHANFTIYHHYENEIEPRSLSVLYDFENKHYDIFISNSDLNFCPKDTMEIGYYNSIDHYIPLYNRPIPPNFIPEHIPAIIKQIDSLKAFL